MKSLLLSGYGINMNVDGGKLHIVDGRGLENGHVEYVYKPKFIDLDNIVVYGHTGSITLDAIRWLTKQNVQLTMLNWNGQVLTTVMPVECKHSLTKIAQYKAFEDNRQRVEIAKRFIDAKVRSSICVLKWMGERYPEVAKMNEKSLRMIHETLALMPKANTVPEVMGIEGTIARIYWETVSITFDKKMEFSGRVYGKTVRPMGAVDPINALFNYGYSLLESQCRKAINSNGLDPYIGFMHQMNPSKSSLVYDLQEPFRWLVDVAILSALEKGVFNKKDFVLTENYNIRIRPESVKKLMAEVNNQFTSRIKYKGQYWEWYYLIDQKALELAHYLTGKRKDLDFSDPMPDLHRIDSDTMRNKILNMPYAEWKKMGFSKGTLHYLKKGVKEDRPFKIYGKVRTKLDASGVNY